VTGRGRARRLATIAACVTASVVATGCSAGVSRLSFPDPPARTVAPPPPPDTLPPGLRAIEELPVAGATTTTLPAIGPGTASINGTVTGPNGPVGGATVEVDRFVGYAYATARTTTAADGTWSFRNILGGDYRIRAWQAPALSMITPDLLFLVGGQPQSATLQLTQFQGPQVQAAINPASPVVDVPANLVVQVTNPVVDANGVVTAPPVAGAAVTLVDGPDWSVANGNPQTTDGHGQATFQLQCTGTGSAPLSAQVGQDPPVKLTMPSCSPPPPTTTTSTTNPFATTTTCPPPPGPAETTTTVLVFGQC